MNPKLIMLGGVGLVILALTTWGFYERSSKLSIKAEYDGFVTKAQILAAERLAENQRKETEYRERLKTAEFAASASLKRLREYTERPRGSLLPSASTSTGIPETTCYNRAGLDAALSKFEEGVTGLLTEGDEAIINVRAWLASWPD